MSDNTMRAGRGLFAKNTVMQYGLQAARYLFPLVTIPYLTRVFGPDIYAIRAYILAVMVFAQIFLDYGFTAYGTKAIALSKRDNGVARSETSAIVYLRLILCALGAIALAALSLSIPIMASNLWFVAISYACVCFKAMLPDFIFQGEEKMGVITYRFVVSQMIATVLIFALVNDSSDLLIVPALETLAAVIAFVWSWVVAVREYNVLLIKVSFKKMLQVFNDSTVFFISNAATIVFTSLTTLMIGVYVEDEAEISYWSIATTAISAIQSLYSPITNSLYPHMCKRRDFVLVKKLLLIGLPAVALGTVLFAVLSDVVMLVLGGTEFLAGSYVVMLLSPVLLFSFPGMLLGFPILAAVGKEKQLTLSSVLASAFHVVGLVALGAAGMFTLTSVSILRCATEAVLLLFRAIFVWAALRKTNASE